MFAYRMSDELLCPLYRILAIIIAILLLATPILVLISNFTKPNIKHKKAIAQQVIATRCPYCHKEFTISERR